MLALGTAALGRPQYINIRQEGRAFQDLETFKDKGRNLLEQAYRSGIRYFDTAPGYGMAEQLVLEWLQTKADTSLQVATKWGYTYVANFDTNAQVHEVKEHSLEKLNEQWRVSKAFLPHLKVYQVHSATLETGVLENEAVLRRLDFLKQEYDIAIGITTTGANQTEVLKKAVDVSVKGNQLFDAFQVTYNVLDQSTATILKELIDHNKKIIIKEALANGRVFRNTDYRQYVILYDKLEQLAKKYRVGVDAIALRFCQQTLPESIVLSGASHIDHLRANLKMDDFVLSEQDLQELGQFQIEPTIYWPERKRLAWN